MHQSSAKLNGHCKSRLSKIGSGQLVTPVYVSFSEINLCQAQFSTNTQSRTESIGGVSEPFSASIRGLLQKNPFSLPHPNLGSNRLNIFT